MTRIPLAGPLLLVLLTLGTPLLQAQTLSFDPFRLSLGRGFTAQAVVPGGPLVLQTPSRSPVAVAALFRDPGQSWESQALAYLLGADEAGTEAPLEIQIKREGPWTTVYWTYGGTRASFGMYWGGRGRDAAALVFRPDPVRAAGRAQYQSLSEITKGVQVTLASPTDAPVLP